MKPIQGIIFDIDGVLEYQGKVTPGAVETLAGLRSRGMHLRFLTNSTLKSRRSCAEKLRRSGFEADEAEVFTASYVTAVYLRSLQPRSCWVMAERAGLDEFQDFVVDDQNPEYVVVGDNRSRFNFHDLNRVAKMLRDGATLIAMQGEQLDSSMGGLELNVGAWAGMLARATGCPMVTLGKPHPYGFELALASMGLQVEDVLVIGDRVPTDIIGGRQMGMRTALVRTGEFDPRELGGETQPDYLLDSVANLNDIL
jgi:HAD superfamily hydrolase (TIGR01458 family)